MLTKKELEDLYLNKKLSQIQISKKLKCSRDKISYWLGKYDIPLRDIFERQRGISEIECEKRIKRMIGKKYHLGFKHSKEVRKKMSEAGLKNPARYWKGKHHSKETREKIRKANLGKKLSVEIREKMSKSKKGNKHPNWQGGITTLTTQIRRCQKYKDWCRQIYERDKFTCQDCGQYAENLNAHHIITFSEIINKFKIDSLLKALNNTLLWDLSNGITLCVKCHKKRHYER